MTDKWVDQDGRAYPVSEQLHEEHLRGQSGKGGIRAYIAHRAKPYLPPWIAGGAVFIAGAGAHGMWAGNPWAAAGGALGSVALTGATWWAGRSTSAQRRLHSAVTVASASMWTTAAEIAGPLTHPIVDLYAMGAPLIAVSWNVRQMMRRTPDGAPAAADGGLMEKVGLARAKLGAAKVEPNRVTAALALPAGEATNDDVAKTLPRIASALDLPTTAVRYQPDPDSARRGELVIVPEDMLAETVEWAGPSLPGGSIADPLTVGRYDDGSPLQLWLPGDPKAKRNATHLLIAGMTGSGKGDGALNILTEVLSRKDVIVVMSDPKSYQDFRPLKPGLDWAVEGGSGTETLVAAVQAAIPARTGWLGQHGYRQWLPEAAREQSSREHTCRPDGAPCGCPGMPYMVAWFEEAASTLRDLGDSAFTGIAQEARSAGVSLIVSLQRPSYDQMSTSTRASLPSVLTFGVDPRDEGFVLPDEVLDAGAHPGAWRNRRPGYCYLVTAGVDEQRFASPGRTWWFAISAVSGMEVLAQWAQRNGAVADPVTAMAFRSVAGRAYTGRAAAVSDEEPRDAVPAGYHHQDQDEDEDMTDSGPLVDPEDEDIDPEEELPESQPGDDTPIFGADQGDTPKDPRAAIEALLREFEEAGHMVIQTKDLMDHCDRHGRSRPWVAGELGRLGREGRLVDAGRNRYRIVPTLTPA
jgi:hypothetical protein